MNEISFFVPSCPRPGGSKVGTVIRRKGGEIVMKNGRPIIAMRDMGGQNTHEWRSNVAFFARQAMEARVPLFAPLRLTVRFVMPRPKGHYGSGRKAGELKASAPHHHAITPDTTKLLRALEDAMTGIVFVDDKLVVQQVAEKVYGEKPGAFVKVEEIEQQARSVVEQEASELFAGV